MMISLSDTLKAATLSTCEQFRFRLFRQAKPPAVSWRWVGWVLNNPSTADGETDDATIRRLWALSQTWGYNSIYVANVNPYRSTNPKAQRVPDEATLAVNDSFLLDCMAQCPLVVCGWGDGALPELVERTVPILHGCGPLHVLRVTKNGNPGHPLYLHGNLKPQQWTPTKWLQ